MDDTLKEILARLALLEIRVDRLLKKEDELKEAWQMNGALDPLMPNAIEILKGRKEISASVFQRHLRVGYARAARILDELQEKGYVSEPRGSKPRLVLKSA